MQGLCNDHIKTARPPLKGASSLKMQAFNTLPKLFLSHKSNGRTPYIYNSSTQVQDYYAQTSSTRLNTEYQRSNHSKYYVSLPDITTPKKIFYQNGASAVSATSWPISYKLQQDSLESNRSSRILPPIDTKSVQNNYKNNPVKFPSLSSAMPFNLVDADADLKFGLKNQRSRVRQYSDNYGYEKIENLIRDRNELFERFAEKIEQTQLKTERFNRNDNCLSTRGQELPEIKEQTQITVSKNDAKNRSNMGSDQSSSQIPKENNYKQMKNKERSGIFRSSRKENQVIQLDFRRNYSSPNLTPIYNMIEEDISMTSFLLETIDMDLQTKPARNRIQTEANEKWESFAFL